MALVDDLIKYLEAIHAGDTNKAEKIRSDMSEKYDKAINIQSELIRFRDDMDHGYGYRTEYGYKSTIDDILSGTYRGLHRSRGDV